jgi:DNA-binding transcriptional LysR family regulator
MAKRTHYLDLEAEIDLRKLRYFLAVAEQLNFGRAAQELILAQPALSRAIKALEEDLGVVLFDRDHHTVRLTDAGRVLVAEAEGLLSRVGAARRRVRAAVGPITTLTIGFRPDIVSNEVMQRFGRAHPGVAVVTQRIDCDEQCAPVLDERVDIAWVRTPIEVSGVDIEPLFADREVLALPLAHPLASAAEIVLADLAAEPMLRSDSVPTQPTGKPTEQRAAELPAACTGTPSVTSVTSMEEKLEAVALGSGLALVPASAAACYQRPDVVYRPVADVPPYRVALATAAGRRRRPEVEAFLNTALAVHRTARTRDEADALPVT